MAFSPIQALSTQRPDIAESFEAFDLEAQEAGFVAFKVLPRIDVKQQAGVFGYITAENLISPMSDVRAPGSSYNRGSNEFTFYNFSTQEHGVESSVDDRESAMYENYFSQEVMAARRSRDVVLRNAEILGTAILTDTTNAFTVANQNVGAITSTSWTSIGTTSGVAWSNVGTSATPTSDPVTDIIYAKQLVYNNSGLIADTVVLSYTMLASLRRNWGIINQIKFAGVQDPGMPMGTFQNMLAELFGVRQVLVAGGQYNNVNQNVTGTQAQKLTLASIWPNGYVLVCKSSDSPDFKTGCIGRTFVWSGDGAGEGVTVESYVDQSRRANIIRCRMDYQQQLLLPRAGVLLTSAY